MPGLVPLVTQGQNQVTYYEAPAYRETWAVDGVELSRHLRVAWSKRFAFLADMVGYANWDGVQATFSRQIPEPDLYFKWMSCVSCTLVETLGVPNQDPVTGNIIYNERNAAGIDDGVADGWAVYECKFKPLYYNLVADAQTTSELQRYVQRDLKFSTDSLTIPGQSLQWDNTDLDWTASAGTVIAEPSAKVFPYSTFIYQWFQVPGDPATGMLPLFNIVNTLGKVNTADFDSGYGPWTSTTGTTKCFPAGTLLLANVEARRVRAAASQPLWNITYQFLHRPNYVSANNLYKGHNGLFNRFANLFLTVKARVMGQPAIYATADFTKLFTLT